MEDLNSLWPDTTDEESGVFFTSHGVDFELPQEGRYTNWIVDCLEREGYDLQRIDYIFCTDDYLLQVNREHLHHDFYTDIITFPLEEDPVSAEIYISIDRVKENAKSLDLPFQQELNRVMIHGVLHLCGYDDHAEDDVRTIRQQEDEYLKRLNA